MGMCNAHQCPFNNVGPCMPIHCNLQQGVDFDLAQDAPDARSAVAPSGPPRTTSVARSQKRKAVSMLFRYQNHDSLVPIAEHDSAAQRSVI